MNRKVQALILGIVCFILVIGICVQVKTVNSSGSMLSNNQSQNELRDQVLKMKEKYENTYNQLQKAEEELEKTRASITSNDEGLKALEEEIKKDNILLGLTDAKGKGAIITISDGISNPNTLKSEELLIHNTDILSIVNELKNAGAEAIEVNGQRIVGGTAILCDGNVITVNKEKVTSPFTITAVGMPELLSTLKRAGGYLEILEQDNIKTSFEKKDKVSIDKYTGIMNFKYAKSVT